MRTKFSTLLCVWAFLISNDFVSGSFPKATDVTWLSLNFKTILQWGPKPVNYLYTVEYAKKGENRERSPLCIQTNETECDLTTELKDLKGRYSADVLSQPIQKVSSDGAEFPHTTSDWFVPYNDTLIGKPEFEIKVSEDKRKITLYITDVPTALLHGQNKRMTIRDIFKDDLKYKVFYRKASSSGKKEKVSALSEIELTDLDRGESYCFNVQAYLPFRKTDKQLGELSLVKCSPKNSTIFEEYSLVVIICTVLCIIVIISVLITLIVLCCKHGQNAKRKGPEGVSLKSV
ncbi:coagulation factor IIIa [Hoplias malabaricus]|uniref:coagulation factor IIIa n=1 Tax=Hoplias malabaricus TaxID=27720 RepID=UPI003461A4FA